MFMSDMYDVTSSFVFSLITLYVFKDLLQLTIHSNNRSNWVLNVKFSIIERIEHFCIYVDYYSKLFSMFEKQDIVTNMIVRLQLLQ